MQVLSQVKNAYGWRDRPTKGIPELIDVVKYFLEAKSENSSCATTKGNVVYVYDGAQETKPAKDMRMVYILTAAELIEFKRLVKELK